MSETVDSLGEDALRALKEQLGAREPQPEQPKAPEQVLKEMTPEEAEAIAQQKRARVAQVLTRGILNDKMQRIFDKCIQEGWGGKFVRDTDEDIVRHENLGFTFVYAEGAKTVTLNALGRVVVGDLVLMTISPEDRAILKQVKAEGVRRKLGSARSEYKRQTEQHAEREGIGVQSIDAGRTEVIHSTQ